MEPLTTANLILTGCILAIPAIIVISRIYWAAWKEKKARKAEALFDANKCRVCGCTDDKLNKKLEEARKAATDATPEYLEFRCCMCPNQRNSPEKTICPPGPFGTPESPCRFVKAYTDHVGWKHRVMSGAFNTRFIAHVQAPWTHDKEEWYSSAILMWQKTFDEAQADLNKYAKENGWKEWHYEL